MDNTLVTFGLGVLVTLVVIVIVLVASSRTSVGAMFLPRGVMDATKKVAGESAIVDAHGDGVGGFILKLRGSAGLSDITVVRCGELTVSTAHRRDVTYPVSGSFTFGSMELAPPVDSRITQEALARGRLAIQETLTSKGFPLVEDAKEATLVVQLFPAYDGPVTATDLDRHHGFYSVDEPSRNSASASPLTPVYERGSLVVDVSLSGSALLLWRSAALADVSLEDDADRKLARLRAAATAMFDGFPPTTAVSGDTERT